MFDNNFKALSVVKSHSWGNYYQIIVNDHTLLRSIRIYKDGMNSLHSHDVEELMIVESGSINYHYKPIHSENVIVRLCKPGDVIFVNKQTPHRIEYVSGEFVENGIPFAQLYELCLGENNNGNYEITRYETAREGTLKP